MQVAALIAKMLACTATGARLSAACLEDDMVEGLRVPLGSVPICGLACSLKKPWGAQHAAAALQVAPALWAQCMCC